MTEPRGHIKPRYTSNVHGKLAGLAMSALSAASPAISATTEAPIFDAFYQHPGDDEEMRMVIHDDGRVSFSKEGPYEGGKIGLGDVSYIACPIDIHGIVWGATEVASCRGSPLPRESATIAFGSGPSETRAGTTSARWPGWDVTHQEAPIYIIPTARVRVVDTQPGGIDIMTGSPAPIPISVAPVPASVFFLISALAGLILTRSKRT